jgi:hypothetical protein
MSKDVAARLGFEAKVRRLRVFATCGDELALQNAADSCGVKLEIGGEPGKALSPPLPMERIDEEGNKTEPTKWFVAYLHVSTASQVERVYVAFMTFLNHPTAEGLSGFRDWLSRA